MGLDERTFEEYNKSRSVTLDNLTKRHGFEKGEKIWNEYCERQKFTTSLEYFKQKYGEEKGIEKYNNFSKARLFARKFIV